MFFRFLRILWFDWFVCLLTSLSTSVRVELVVEVFMEVMDCDVSVLFVVKLESIVVILFGKWLVKNLYWIIILWFMSLWVFMRRGAYELLGSRSKWMSCFGGCNGVVIMGVELICVCENVLKFLWSVVDLFVVFFGLRMLEICNLVLLNVIRIIKENLFSFALVSEFIMSLRSFNNIGFDSW